MKSRRAKLTLALLAMSLATIVVVGATAKIVMLSRFDDVVVDRAIGGFLSEVTDYYRVYGSWESARASESFFEFVTRTRPREVRPAPGSPPLNAAGEPPEERGPRPPDRSFEMGGGPPPFLVVDRDGVVMLPLAGFQVGDRVSDERLVGARPILDGTEEIGLAVASRRPVLTKLEERYLSVMEDSWFYSLLLASALAIPLGVLLGGRLASPIRDMTSAMRRMQDGNLRQFVAVSTGDELGRLSEGFNVMSARLADAYEALESSRERLGVRVDEMSELSRRDELTGLLNRRTFNEQASSLLAQAKRYERPLSIAMLDIDRFKRINDDFSHAIGDEVLIRASRILNSNLRDVDVVARCGGEEFVVAFPETDLDSAAVLAERIRKGLEEADWSPIDLRLAVTVSIGLHDASASGSLEEALGCADEKLYRAKGLGRNRVER